MLCACSNADTGRENTQAYLDGFRPTQVQYASDPLAATLVPLPLPGGFPTGYGSGMGGNCNSIFAYLVCAQQ